MKKIAALEARVADLEHQNAELTCKLTDFEWSDPYAEIRHAMETEYVNNFLLKEALDELLISPDVRKRSLARIGLAAIYLLERGE